MFYPEHIRLFSNLFFTQFPRDAGFPDRRTVHSLDEFIDKAMYEYASSPCFMNLYNEVISFLWIDIDDKEWNQEKLFSSVRDTYYKTFTDELKINPNDIILVYSGKKGYHYYIQNTPIRIPPNGKALVSFKNSWKHVLTYVTRDLLQADSPLFTDNRRLTRIPGIKRPEGTICFALNPQELFKFNSLYEYLYSYGLNWDKIIKTSNAWLKTIRPTKRNYLAEIRQKTIDIDWKIPIKQNNVSVEDLLSIQENKDGYGKTVDHILKRSLSAETYLGVHQHNPLNSVRITYALALLHKGFTVEDIVSFTSTLQWFDYDSDVTRNRVQYCKDKYIDKVI